MYGISPLLLFCCFIKDLQKEVTYYGRNNVLAFSFMGCITIITSKVYFKKKFHLSISATCLVHFEHVFASELL